MGPHECIEVLRARQDRQLATIRTALGDGVDAPLKLTESVGEPLATELQLRLAAAQVLSLHEAFLDQLEVRQACEAVSRLMDQCIPHDPAWGEAAATNIRHRFENIDSHVSSSPETNELLRAFRDAAALLELAEQVA